MLKRNLLGQKNRKNNLGKEIRQNRLLTAKEMQFYKTRPDGLHTRRWDACRQNKR